MSVPPTEVFIKTKRITDIGDIMAEIEKIREANPHRTIKVSIEVDPRI